MAVAAVTFEGTRVNDAEALGTVWTDTANKSAAQEPDFVWQGTFSVSEKVGTTALGVKYYDSVTSHDYSTTPRTAILKHIATNSAALNIEGSTGGILWIGSNDLTNYYHYYVVGGDTYPATSSWLITPIDPNVAVYRDNTTGTIDLTAVDMYGWYCQFNASSKSENVAMDAIDFVDNGKGLLIVGGDGADTDGVFQDFIIKDQDTIGNRWGLATEIAGVKYAVGTWTIGSATATVFTDSNETLVWPDGLYDSGFAGLKLDLQNATNVVTLSACTFVGDGIKATNDTRPNLTVSGTSGSAALTGCSFLNFDDTTFTSVVTATSCVWVGPESMTHGSATVSYCTFDSPTVATSVAFMTTTALESITFCAFTSSGTGHAIEITSSDGTETFSGNTFTGYGTTGTGNSAIYNNSGGAITINIASDGDTPSYTNGISATTTIVNSRTITLTGLVANSEVRIYETGTQTELDGIENSSTTFPYTYPFADAGNGVDIVVHSLAYEYLRLTNFILPTTSSSIPIQQRKDRNYDNP